MRNDQCVRETAPVPRETLLERALQEVLGALRSIANDFARSQSMDGLDTAGKIRGRVLIAERLLDAGDA